LKKKNSEKKEQKSEFEKTFGNLMEVEDEEEDDEIEEEPPTSLALENSSANEQKENDKTMATEYLQKLQQITKNSLHKWYRLIKLIMDGMTDELRPFCETGRRDDLTFDEMYQESLCDNPSASLDPTFYLRTLHMWICQFIPIYFFEIQSFDDTLRAVLSCFARHFITIIHEGDEIVYYIYNINQSKFLKAYPSNQWVLDKAKRSKDSHTIIERWLRFLYEQLVKPNLIRCALERSIYMFFDVLETIGINTGDCKSIHPLHNAGADSDRIFSNIAYWLANEKQNPPHKLDIANTNYLPVRNGIIQFLENGYTFSTNTYGILMHG
jgi:hypothetical protein